MIQNTFNVFLSCRTKISPKKNAFTFDRFPEIHSTAKEKKKEKKLRAQQKLQ